jgi:hypothetical protein
VNPRCCPGEPASRLRKSVDASGSVLSAAVLVLLPKCPACLAAYLAAGAGVGVTLTTASHLRTALLVLSLACLTYVVGRSAFRWLARISPTFR